MCFDGPKPSDRPSVHYKTQAHLRLDNSGRCQRFPQHIRSIHSSTTGGSTVRCESLPVTFEGYTYRSEIAFKEGSEKAPVILVFPNYAGKKQFDVDQAVFLAKLGYVGVAVDLYKETPEYSQQDRNPNKDTPEELVAKHWRGAFGSMNGLLRNPATLRGLMAATLATARGHSHAHPKYAGGIGYCFGGACVLECVRGGLDMQAVVSFHGVLQTFPLFIPGLMGGKKEEKEFDRKVNPAPFTKYTSECKVLIENGDLDTIVPPPSIDAFKKEMDEQKVDWQFHNHAQTPHGFALPLGVWATDYNEAADRRSTLSMISLFVETWPEFSPDTSVSHNAAGAPLGQVISKL